MKSGKSGKTSHAYYKSILIRALSVIFVCTLAVSAIVFAISYRSSAKALKNAELNVTSLIASNVSNYFSQSANIDSYFSKFSTGVPLNGSVDKETGFWLKKVISDDIRNYNDSYGFLDGIYVKIGNINFDTGSIHESFSNLDGGNKIFNFSGIDCYRETEWPHRLFFKRPNTENVSYNEVVLSLSSRKISDAMFKSAEDRQIFVTDENGNIIFSSSESTIGKNLFEIYGIKKISKDTDTFSTKINGKKKTAYASRSNELPLTAVSFTPSATLIYATSVSFLYSLAICILMECISLTSCYYIIKRIYKPIEDIVETFQYHMPSDMENFENEIEYINSNINSYIKTKDMLNKNIEKLHIAQIQALQSQINPHFLYNTLDNIKTISVNILDIDNPIETSLVELNTILHESINQADIIVPLRKEIEFTKSYISLMKLRFPNSFDVVWNIDVPSLEVPILKFIMQPIIENSITHGFLNTGKNQNITIHIFLDNDNLCIEISDNGCGIPSDELEKIRAKLYNPDTKPAEKHIGLINVQLRIRLLYGNEYGLKISSSTIGTKCILSMPLNKEKHIKETTERV